MKRWRLSVRKRNRQCQKAEAMRTGAVFGPPFNLGTSADWHRGGSRCIFEKWLGRSLLQSLGAVVKIRLRLNIL